MKPPLPLCCHSAAFELMKRQVAAVHSPDALIEGAIAISLHQLQDTNQDYIDRVLQSYADTVRARVRGNQQQALIAHLHDFLFEDLGFHVSEEYYDPNACYLPFTLKHKHGLPITLCLIYKAVADRIGVRCSGVGLPGHFVVTVECDGKNMLVDVADKGRVITPGDARHRMQAILGDEIKWSEDFLEPVSNLHWLTRLMQNVMHIFAANREYCHVAAMLEMEMLLWPTQTHLQRDLALVLARLGMSHPASLWLNEYLSTNPDDPQKDDLVELLDKLSA